MENLDKRVERMERQLRFVTVGLVIAVLYILYVVFIVPLRDDGVVRAKCFAVMDSAGKQCAEFGSTNDIETGSWTYLMMRVPGLNGGGDDRFAVWVGQNDGYGGCSRISLEGPRSQVFMTTRQGAMGVGPAIEISGTRGYLRLAPGETGAPKPTGAAVE